ncbi:MAG TPA: hypothetical protein VJS44_14280 [Pyrinomonadaceae bacterium]|nr:hypothetical protein [Pyrinomonadaceae bacterium]
MRRTILYISLALLTFTAGFLTTGRTEQLQAALPVALTIFILIKGVARCKLTTHRLKVAFLTLLIWTPFAAITLRTALPAPTTCVIDLPKEEETLSSEFAARQITFRHVTLARVMTVDRGCVDMDIYESSDGIKVYTSTEDYDSAERANAELQAVLRKRDLEIIDRETLFDVRGRKLGERIIGAGLHCERGFGSIYWTEGNRLSYIGSSSLSRALQFEDSRRFIMNDGF